MLFNTFSIWEHNDGYDLYSFTNTSVYTWFNSNTFLRTYRALKLSHVSYYWGFLRSILAIRKCKSCRAYPYTRMMNAHGIVSRRESDDISSNAKRKKRLLPLHICYQALDSLVSSFADITAIKTGLLLHKGQLSMAMSSWRNVTRSRDRAISHDCRKKAHGCRETGSLESIQSW